MSIIQFVSLKKGHIMGRSRHPAKHRIYIAGFSVVLIAMLALYAAGNVFFSPISNMSRNWNVTFPHGAYVTFHKEDIGFQGDGTRFTTITLLRFSNVENTVLDTDDYSAPSEEDFDTINSVEKELQIPSSLNMDASHHYQAKRIYNHGGTLLIIGDSNQRQFYCYEFLQ
ncbi:hypothetical protein [Bifidobacterium lemurum]|nr:hypothetical protein [Bifidobacterium lemurum]QOL33375.1 hypothetical protein BL8807_05995 [Bifidobacterium lemurum]